ncbi:hypothetical protein Q7P35_005201 [Cladosporium inversicolor]
MLEEAERILLNFRDELHAQIEKNSQVESACRDSLQLAISTHVPVAASHARLLQGLIEARNLDNASASASRRESQAIATFKRSDERLAANDLSTNLTGYIKTEVKGALYPETRRDSRSDSTGRSTGDTRLTVEPGCLFAEDCDIRLASAPITTAKRCAGDAIEAVSVNLRNLEDSLAAENSVQDQQHSHTQGDTCKQSCEANATSASSAPRRQGTQGNTNLFVSGLEPLSLPSSQSQRSGSGTPSASAAYWTASLNLATGTVQGGSVTAELIADGTNRGPGSFTASTSPDIVNAASNYSLAPSFQLSRDTVFETATNSLSLDSFELNVENEHDALLQDLPPHSSFFKEEYDATMAARSP